MVEQTGSIYLECEEGHLHTNSFNDIIIRDQNTLEPKKFNHEELFRLFQYYHILIQAIQYLQKT